MFVGRQSPQTFKSTKRSPKSQKEKYKIPKRVDAILQRQEKLKSIKACFSCTEAFTVPTIKKNLERPVLKFILVALCPQKTSCQQGAGERTKQDSSDSGGLGLRVCQGQDETEQVQIRECQSSPGERNSSGFSRCIWQNRTRIRAKSGNYSSGTNKNLSRFDREKHHS